ncbi:unnamed protein product, partial [Heterosigma akashiwo]
SWEIWRHLSPCLHCTLSDTMNTALRILDDFARVNIKPKFFKVVYFFAPSRAFCDSAAAVEYSFNAENKPFPPVPSHLALEQIISIARHGDRAQISRSIGQNMPETEETTRFWFSKLPKKEDLEFLNRFHPVLKARGEDFPTRDQGQEPYGQLTEKGLMEHRALGESLRRHALAHGLLPARLGEEEEEEGEG